MSWYKIEKYIKIGALSHELKVIEEEHDKKIRAETIDELEKKLKIWDNKVNAIPNYVWKCIKQLKEQKKMNGLTRTELIEMICLTDATYDCNQGNCSSSCDKCDDILNYLLNRYDEKVRADAIEEYRRTLSDICCRDNYSSAYLLDLFKRTAEQLKEQK